MLDPLFAEGPIIASHAIAAMAASVLGAVQFALPKGTTLHRRFGLAWCALMIFVAVGGFFIHEIRMIGPFSPIHLLSLLVIYGVINGILAIRAKQVERHRYAMISLYGFALVVTAAFTLLPGRVMHSVFFGG